VILFLLCHDSDDILSSDVGIWSIVEAGTGLIACSLATLKPLLRKCFGWKGSYGSGTHSRIDEGSVRNPSKARMANNMIELGDGPASKRGKVTTVIETASKNRRGSLDGSSDEGGVGGEWPGERINGNSTENILAEPMPAWSGIRMTTKVESHIQPT